MSQGQPTDYLNIWNEGQVEYTATPSDKILELQAEIAHIKVELATFYWNVRFSIIMILVLVGGIIIAVTLP